VYFFTKKSVEEIWQYISTNFKVIGSKISYKEQQITIYDGRHSSAGSTYGSSFRSKAPTLAADVQEQPSTILLLSACALGHSGPMDNSARPRLQLRARSKDRR